MSRENTQQEISGAFVDWLGMTVKLPELISHGGRHTGLTRRYPESHDADPGDIAAAFDYVFALLSDVFRLEIEEKTGTKQTGWQGYLFKREICTEEGAIGWVALGGAAQNYTASIQITGYGCRILLDGTDHHALAKRLEQNSITPKRVDLAVDDHTGQRVNVADAVETLRNGEFFNGQGRRPTARLVDDLGSNQGKTLYVGSRTCGKFLRVYEKGKQLGDESSTWTRAECEFKAQTERPLNWDLIREPARYLAGTYAWLSWVSEVGRTIRSIQKVRDVSHDRLVTYLRRQAGRAFNAVMTLYDNDFCEVERLIRATQLPEGFTETFGIVPPVYADKSYLRYTADSFIH